MALEKYHLYRLEQDTEILPFDSSDNDLNDFLFDDAKKYLDDLLAVTYMFVDEACQKTVAYFSLLNDRVSLDSGERSFWNRLNRRIANPKRKKYYPAVKVGRLAVSNDYAGEGVGREIWNISLYSLPTATAQDVDSSPLMPTKLPQGSTKNAASTTSPKRTRLTTRA